jgi:hypothetical protein
MKMYTTMHPSELLVAARRLLTQDFLLEEIPQFWFGDYSFEPKRSIAMGPGVETTDYWRVDFTLFTDPEHHTVTSPYAPAHKEMQGMGMKAATFDQWGIFLAALFDVASEMRQDGGATYSTAQTIRLAGGVYDPLTKSALRQRDGSRYPSSADMFAWKTCHQYSSEMRARGSVSLACRAHKWTVSDKRVRCSKCDRLYRIV